MSEGLIKDGPPEHLAASFRCPWCGVAAQQIWEALYKERIRGEQLKYFGSDAMLCTCYVCDAISLWYEGRMVVPIQSLAPLPHPDLPDALRHDYLEARDIAQRSPRGAAALLRLVIEQLCPLAGGEGKDLNACIGNLVAKGLPAEVKEMLDTVRVLGNEAVHLAELDLRDDAETVDLLFWLVNEITDETITRRKKIRAGYAKLPQRKIDGIANRDKS